MLKIPIDFTDLREGIAVAFPLFLYQDLHHRLFIFDYYFRL
jgi:hypothetical protein